PGGDLNHHRSAATHAEQPTYATADAGAPSRAPTGSRRSHAIVSDVASSTIAATGLPPAMNRCVTIAPIMTVARSNAANDARAAMKSPIAPLISSAAVT